MRVPAEGQPRTQALQLPVEQNEQALPFAKSFVHSLSRRRADGGRRGDRPHRTHRGDLGVVLVVGKLAELVLALSREQECGRRATMKTAGEITLELH